MSKYYFKIADFYYPNSTVPKNRLHITDPQTLHEIEGQLLFEAYELFSSQLSDETTFDESYFKSLHKRTFESLYERAGVYRDFDVAKDGSLFCRGAFVQNESKRIFEALKRDNYLKNIDSKEELAERIAFYQCELIALHPFYELNGRIIRLFFDLIAIYNGFYPIDYSHYSPKEYIRASKECVQNADCKKLRKIILTGLRK